MAGQIVYKRTNIDGVLTLNYTDGDISVRYIIDEDMMDKIPNLRWSNKHSSLIDNNTINLAKLIIHGKTPLGDSFIKYHNMNKFDLRRTNLEVIKKNSYYIDPNNDEVILLYIQSSIKMATPTIIKFDRKFLNHMSKYLWHITSKGYIRSSHLEEKDVKTFHHLIFELSGGEIDPKLIIDHIDRDKCNNCASNLRQVTVTINNRNRNFLSRSESGVVGVFRHGKYWSASVPNISRPGKSKQFYFSISKYGDEKAKQLAIEKRKEWEAKLNITSIIV